MVSRPQNSIPRMLWSVYRPPFSETLCHRLLSSQSVATSVFTCRGCLLPILATSREKISQTVCDRERHVSTTQLFKPTQLRVKPATSITISPTTTNVNATTANAAPKTNTATTTAVNVITNTASRDTNTCTTKTANTMTITLSVRTARSEGSRRENAEGELGAKGGQTRGDSREENERVCTTTPNNNDEQLC